MSYQSSVDIPYYVNKYQIPARLDKKDILMHYYRTGRKLGYFPNITAEIYYCRMRNFDASYYSTKYSDTLKNLDPLSHWKRYGYNTNNPTNECEENGQHLINCKCQIKENVTDLNNSYLNKCHIMNISTSDTCDNDIPSVASDDELIKEKEKEKDREITIKNNKMMKKNKTLISTYEVHDCIKSDLSIIPKKNNDNNLKSIKYNQRRN